MVVVKMFHSKQYGFNLVELMVVVAVIGIVAAVAAPSYRAWIQNTKVRTAAESILNGIQKARSEALMRNTPVRFTLGANSAWTVECVTPAARACNDLTSGIVEVRNNNDGGTSAAVIAPNPGGANNVTFTGLGVKSTTATNQLNEVGVSFANADRNLNITLGAGGNVRLCDPNASSTDPRKC